VAFYVYTELCGLIKEFMKVIIVQLGTQKGVAMHCIISERDYGSTRKTPYCRASRAADP
jgi:hypothetical protein